MIFALALISFLGLIIALIRLLPDLSRFIWSKTKSIRFPNEFVDFSSIGVTLFFTAIIAATGLLFYKFSVALIAYFLSDGLISFFVLLRGVFSITNDAQDPFVFKHLLSGWLLTPAVQFLAVYLIFHGVRKFMTEMNKKYGTPPSYDESDALYFGFIAIVIFVLLDLVLYSQSIPTVSQIGHLVFLGLSKVAIVLFYLTISHIKLLQLEGYRNSILNYVEMKPKVQAVVFTPWLTLLTTYLIALALQFPFFSGTQFLENNWLIVGILILACTVGYLCLRLFLAKGFNYLGVVMLVEGPSELGPSMNILKPENQKKFMYLIGATGIFFILFKWKLFFFSITLLLLGLSALLLLLILTYLSGLSFSVIRAKIKGFSLPFIQYKAILTYLSQSAKSFLRGVVLMVGAIFLIFSFLTFFPKPFEYDNDSFVNAVFDEEDNLLYRDHHDGNPSIPIIYSEVPPFLIKCLTLQEDRKFFNQDNWLPNKSNWHGFSMAILYRYFTGGGGSNITQQLVKNMAFKSIFPQDIQRKLAETLTAYQLSIQSRPEEIITGYLNDVGFNGGRGHSGIVNGSIQTFGRPLQALNNLEMLYLVSTLKWGSGFNTSTGYINYSEVGFHANEIKEALLEKAQYWFDKGLLTRQELFSLRNQQLRFTADVTPNPCFITTNELIRKRISKANHSVGRYKSCLSVLNQQAIEKAVSAFEGKFANRLNVGDNQLYSAAIVVDISSGNVIGHYGGKGVTDLTTLGSGYPVGSVIKPFILLELLEQGWKFDEVRLYDGKLPGRFTPNNYSGRYSNQYVGINTVLGKSLNAPMVNIRELTNPIDLFRSVENRLSEIEVSQDPYIDLSDGSRYGEYEVNYPLGSRNMTLLDIAQVYQMLLNGGKYKELSVLKSYTDPQTGETNSIPSRSRQIYQSGNADAIKSALFYAMKPGGTGTHILPLLPQGRKYYAKTGTTDEGKHGYTVLSDGQILIVSWASYCKETEGHLDCNNSPQIPYGSGARSAGILAGLIYKNLQ